MAAIAKGNTEETFVICKIPQNSDSHIFFKACYTGGKKDYHKVAPTKVFGETKVFGGHFMKTSKQELSLRQVNLKRDFRELLKRPGAWYHEKDLKSGKLNAKGWVLQISLLCDQDGLVNGLEPNLLYPDYVGDLYVVIMLRHQPTGAIVPQSFRSETEADAQMKEFDFIYTRLKEKSRTVEVMALEEFLPYKKCTEVQVKISAFRGGSGSLNLVSVELKGEESAMNFVKEELEEFTWYGCKGMLLDDFPKAWTDKKLFVESFNVLLQSIYAKVAGKVEGITLTDAYELWQQELHKSEHAPEKNRVFVYKNAFEATFTAHVEVHVEVF